MEEHKHSIGIPPIQRIGGMELLRELHRLQCFFFASKLISSAEDDVAHTPASQVLADDVQEDEIMSTLLNAGIRLRLLHDEVKDRPNGGVFQMPVGVLQGNILSNEVEKLYIREACNKIIHARDVGFFVDEKRFNAGAFISPRFLEPRIALYGRFKGADWRTELCITSFVEAGYHLCRCTSINLS